MQIMVNGTARELCDGVKLDEFVAEMGYEKSKIAVELNGDIIPKAEYAERGISSGDRIEIVAFVGGG